MDKKMTESCPVLLPSNNGGEPSPPSDSPAVSDNHEARLRRVLDYQASSLQKEDALAANLGSMNSGMMHVGLWLEETIEQSLACGPRTIERLHHIMPAIDTYLRVTRQVDRFAQIELRAAESRKPKTDSDDVEGDTTNGA